MCVLSQRLEWLGYVLQGRRFVIAGVVWVYGAEGRGDELGAERPGFVQKEVLRGWINTYTQEAEGRD